MPENGRAILPTQGDDEYVNNWPVKLALWCMAQQIPEAIMTSSTEHQHAAQEKRKRLAIVAGSLAIVAASFVAFATMLRGDEGTLVDARKVAFNYLSSPTSQSIAILGDKTLFVACPGPKVEDEFISAGKRHYVFKVICADGRVGYLNVSMRGETGPAYIGISRESPILSDSAK